MKVTYIKINPNKAAVFLNKRLIAESAGSHPDDKQFIDCRVLAEAVSSELSIPLSDYYFDHEPDGAHLQWSDYLQRVNKEQHSAPSSVPVAHWDSYAADGQVMTHQIDVADQRKENGQLFLDVTKVNENADVSMGITIEINSNPLNDAEHVPCAHIHFDGDHLALSLFKVGRRILARPESDVVVEPTIHKIRGFNEQLFWIESM